MDNSWRIWIAYNLMLQNTSESILAILVENGIDAALARAEITAALSHPYLQAGMALSTKLKKREWLIDTYRKLYELNPHYDQVERRAKLSKADFIRDYYSTNRPVVITGAFDDWPALQNWSPEYLKAHYGHVEVEAQTQRQSNPNYEIERTRHSTLMRLADFVDQIQAVDTSNDLYITANNGSRNQQVLAPLWNDIKLLTDYLADHANNKGFFWLGPKGTITPLHHDLTNNFMAQVYGKKLVRLIPSCYLPYLYNHLHCYSEVDLDHIDYERYPLMRQAKIIDVEIGPGDLLFLPIGCWHYVRGLEISITMTFTNFALDNDFASNYSTHNLIGL